MGRENLGNLVRCGLNTRILRQTIAVGRTPSFQIVCAFFRYFQLYFITRMQHSVMHFRSSCRRNIDNMHMRNYLILALNGLHLRHFRWSGLIGICTSIIYRIIILNFDSIL